MLPNVVLGEKALRRILEYAERIADRALPDDAHIIRRATAEIGSMTDSLCELRANGQVNIYYLRFLYPVISSSRTLSGRHTAWSRIGEEHRRQTEGFGR